LSYELVHLSDNTCIMLLHFTAYIDDPREFIDSIRALEPRVTIQVLNTDNILREQVIEVVKQSIEARKRSILLADRIEIDIMLRLACTEQISKAIELIGLRRGVNNALVVALGEDDVVSRLGERLSSMLHTTEFKEISYNDLQLLHGIDEGEVSSVIAESDLEALIGILAERANLLYR
jgi:tRNA threonylcarbamoyladenosine modification (KEOPS) complex Cgi121 subunit